MWDSEAHTVLTETKKLTAFTKAVFQRPETYESDLTHLLFSDSLTQAPSPPGDLIWSRVWTLLTRSNGPHYFRLLLYKNVPLAESHPL